MKQNTAVIGLTGQTGAGKSTVGESLLRRGAAWVDADLIAHDVADNEKAVSYTHLTLTTRWSV